MRRVIFGEVSDHLLACIYKGRFSSGKNEIDPPPGLVCVARLDDGGVEAFPRDSGEKKVSNARGLYLVRNQSLDHYWGLRGVACANGDEMEIQGTARIRLWDAGRFVHAVGFAGIESLNSVDFWIDNIVPRLGELLKQIFNEGLPERNTGAADRLIRRDISRIKALIDELGFITEDFRAVSVK
jgi:hypothetical protein